MSPSIPARGLLGLIQLYKWTLSPLIGRDCRYLPTCSSYAADAVRKHGAWAGSWMATARLCRCHPWGGHGWDPAPETRPRAPFYAPWRYGDWRWKERSPFSPPAASQPANIQITGSLRDPVAEKGLGDEGRSDLHAPHPPAPSPQGRGGEDSA